MNENRSVEGMSQSLSRAAGRVLVALLVGGLLATFAFAGLVGAQPPGNPANPVRTLPGVLTPGQEFPVTVEFTSPADDFWDIGLEDLAPAGWSVRVDHINWCSPPASGSTPVVPWTANKAEYWWNFFTLYGKGVNFTAVYRVRVPSDAVPGTYTFAGNVSYYINGDPTYYQEPIGGDYQLNVAAAHVVGYSVYPVDKLRVLGPWIALGAGIVFGASLLVVMRRRAQT